MAWLRFLFEFSFLVTVGADAVVLCHVFPVFRRTKNRAFLFIALACVLGIIGTVCDHTIGMHEMTGNNYIVYRTIRRFSYFADSILWATGIVLLARPYMNDGQSDPNPPAQ
jgi:hypothetical protein